ncbi:MAG: hypothetical protein C0432_05865 [Candidatus Puniceispirillum sp.]|nr:hypothetical protein [Candidatus Puniceispirillum sp.]
MRIKVAQLVDSLNLGGTERMAVNIANSLADNEVESHLLVTRSLGGLGSFVQSNVYLKVFNKKSKLDFLVFFHLLKHLRIINPQILHVHQTSIYWAILLKPFLPKTKLIWHDHFGQDFANISPMKEMDFFIHFIDTIITVNDKINLYWKNRFPKKSDSIYFLKNFPIFFEIHPKIERSKKFNIINISNIRKEKDQLNLIEALAIIKGKGHQFTTFLIGSLIDLEFLESIKRRIIELNLSEDVQIVGPVSQIIPYLEMADIGVLSSESEGLPVALLEYGMAGLPTVVTRVGQCEQVLGFGEFGWVVPPKSPTHLAEAIEEILLDFTKAEERGQQLKIQIINNFGPKNFLNSYFKILSSLLGK